MSQGGKSAIFSEFFTKGQYETQSEMLAVDGDKKGVTIGIPREILSSEHRVSLVPHSIRTLIGYGHRVIVESNAGEESNFSDIDYSEAGADIASSREQVFKSNIVLKVAPPSLEEIDMMDQDVILMSSMQIPSLTKEFIDKLKKKRITALAMEYLQSEDGSFPIVRIMSEIAGMVSMLTAAEYLTNTNKGRGVLLGGVSGVPPAKVVILGAGVVGEFAVKTALGLGASVRIFDNDISKLMRIQSIVGRQLHTSAINPVYLGYQLMSADVVIGAIHSKTGRTPILITEQMVSRMKEGSVIIDVSIDQGGCIETSEMTTHDNPSFVKHGVIHYCVPNIASKVSRTASVAVSNILTPLLLRTGGAISVEHLLYASKGIRNGCYTYRGCLTNEYLSKRFNMKYTSLDLLLTSAL
ncbi:MAG: alanine dehydrogenase [Saprospiraceae bacterium]|jgi:alanine dehydrogenase|nr:alanine dehydrogenase [Saprospiraceae bacterium]HAI57580.1 alanine dehydrogenase [Saprospirales bacterium]|tara:strand:+ start:1027 stop:2256 length:1230 start_codon:yes stop_codon:yes gene_type:complete